MSSGLYPRSYIIGTRIRACPVIREFRRLLIYFSALPSFLIMFHFTQTVEFSAVKVAMTCQMPPTPNPVIDMRRGP